jgi:hypothetical protein
MGQLEAATMQGSLYEEAVTYTIFGAISRLEDAYRPEHTQNAITFFHRFAGHIAVRFYDVPPDDRHQFSKAITAHALEVGIPTEELRALARRTETYDIVAPRANNLLDRERCLAEADLAAVAERVPRNRWALAAADGIGVRVHGPLPARKNGAPAYTHPQRVASMTFCRLTQLQQEGYPITDAQIEAHTITSLLHDTVEDSTRQALYNQDAFSPHPNGFSPKEIYYVLHATDNPYARIVEKSLFLLTRRKELTGVKTLEYIPYVKRGLPYASFRPAKRSDLQDNNVLDRKQGSTENERTKIAKKQALYDEGIHLIETYDPAHPEEGVEPICTKKKGILIPKPLWEARYHQLIAETTNEELPGMIARLAHHIYGDNPPDHWRSLF